MRNKCYEEWSDLIYRLSLRFCRSRFVSTWAASVMTLLSWHAYSMTLNDLNTFNEYIVLTAAFDRYLVCSDIQLCIPKVLTDTMKMIYLSAIVVQVDGDTQPQLTKISASHRGLRLSGLQNFADDRPTSVQRTRLPCHCWH